MEISVIKDVDTIAGVVGSVAALTYFSKVVNQITNVRRVLLTAVPSLNHFPKSLQRILEKLFDYSWSLINVVGVIAVILLLLFN
jgi:hypothetical protein